MAELEIRQKQQVKNLDYDPVTMDDGTVLDFTLRQEGGKSIVRCSAKKDGKEIGYGTWNTLSDRFSIRVEPMSRTDAKALAEAVFSGIMQIVETELLQTL